MTIRQKLARLACLVLGHAFGGAILRPLWVGAGIVIPMVHLDATCARCGRERVVWRPLPAGLSAPAEPMLVADWLTANGVERPVI